VATFIPEREDKASTALAKKICGTCPEQKSCLAYALAADASLRGVWGATDTRQRQALRRTLTVMATVPLEAPSSFSHNGTLDDVDEPDDAELESIDAETDAPKQSTMANCSECGQEFLPQTRAGRPQYSCGPVCSRARHNRLRHRSRASSATRNPREHDEAFSSGSSTSLETALAFFATLPPEVESVRLTGGWTLSRSA
jgi:hypothetical protein